MMNISWINTLNHRFS